MQYFKIWCFSLDRTQRQEREVMLKLKEVVDKQRDELRAKVQEISSMSKEVEAVCVWYNCADITWVAQINHQGHQVLNHEPLGYKGLLL